ncbi:MAG TPA: TIR domain-containing protein [Pyrinomonadaceae bacterium]|nr:TIR domain-containing protein [Pyrinomonadaceae bacterium]
MSFKNIFICYRREDAEGYAGRLHDHLNVRFPGRIFRDVTGISPGADYTRVIQDKVGGCSALIAIIGSEWLTIEDEDKRRRLFKENDYVRHEIATALTRNITVIPVLVRDAKMPPPESLPPDLAALSLRNAVEISDTDFDYDMGRLIRALEAAFGETTLPVAPAKSSSWTTCLIVSVIAVVLAGGSVLALAFMGYLFSNQTTTTQNVIDFQPAGTWTLQIGSFPPNYLELHQDFTYQTPNGNGTWTYSAQGQRLVLNGQHVEESSGTEVTVVSQITIEGKSGNQFIGHISYAGQVFSMTLTPQ